MSNTKVLHPLVLWAQRKDKLFITIALEDSSSPDINLSESKLEFRSKGGHDQKFYEVVLEFLKPVTPEESKQHVTSREITFNIKKKNEDEPYWPQLLKVPKPHYLKTDFNKWKDEDDSDDDDAAFDNGNFEQMMSQMGSSNSGKPVEPEPEPDSDDSDDDELPDLE